MYFLIKSIRKFVFLRRKGRIFINNLNLWCRKRQVQVFYCKLCFLSSVTEMYWAIYVDVRLLSKFMWSVWRTIYIAEPSPTFYIKSTMTKTLCYIEIITIIFQNLKHFITYGSVNLAQKLDITSSSRFENWDPNTRQDTFAREAVSNEWFWRPIPTSSVLSYGRQVIY